MASGSDNFATDTLATNWAVQNGEFAGTVSGGAWCYNGFYASGHRRTAETYGGDHYAQVTLTSTTSVYDASARVRCQAGSRGYYAGGYNTNDFGGLLYRIWKYVAGTLSLVASHASQTAVVGDVVKLNIAGATLTLSVNGTSILTATDADLTGGAPGLGANGFGTTPQSLLDDFAASDGSGGGGGGGTASDDFSVDHLATDWVVQATANETAGTVSGGVWNTNNLQCGVRRIKETYAGDHSSQVTVLAATGVYDVSARVRCQAGNVRTYYAGGADTNNSGNSVYRIWMYVANVWTSLANHASQTTAVNDIVKLSVAGSLLTLNVNGTDILSVTDTTLTGGMPGFGGGAATATALIDNWIGVNTGGGTAKTLLAGSGAYALVGTATGGGSHVPELPRVLVDTTYAAPSTTVAVHSGADLQAAINAASLNTTLILDAGATFGPINLPKKTTGSGWIYLISSALASLPLGTQVDPSKASLMPKIQTTTTSPAIGTDPGAHHYRFAGVEVLTTWASTTLGTTFNIVLLQKDTGNTGPTDCPTDITFDRCYIHGTTTGNARCGLRLNAIRAAVVDSWVDEIHEVGADSQTMNAANAPGPLKIVNNHLEAAGEVIMFGGADSVSSAMMPSDIEFRNNYLTKQLRWRASDPSYAGIAWSVKNIFELKCAQRILVDNNTMEHNWSMAQNGFGVLFTVRNQDGTAPWTTVTDVTFTNNIVRKTGGGINALGTDYTTTSGTAARLLIRNNTFTDIDGAVWAGTGDWIQISEGGNDYTIDHNTALFTRYTLLFTGNNPPVLMRTSNRLVFTNNICNNGPGFYGDYGLGGANANLAFSYYAPDITVRRNLLIAGNAAVTPVDNYFPATVSAVGFVDAANFDLRLAPTSPYKNVALDGYDPGVIFTAPGAKSIIALPGTYLVTGTAAALVRRVKGAFDTRGGSYNLMGTTANLVRTLAGVTSRRVTLAKAYRRIKAVQVTIQAQPGETAVTARVMDLQANAGAHGGPLIETYDKNGVLVPAHIHVNIVGY